MGSLPKMTKKNIPKSIHEMSKEMLRETLKKKKECNAKALWVVEKLCEAHIDEKWFLANLQFINQCHFDDVTIERAISKMCGYPLCDQELNKVPVQQYHISSRYNKVFDITEKKNFCSSTCYKSAMHVKMQLLTSPLWFRDKEVIPEFTVLKSSKSSMGKEVVFFPNKVKPEPDDLKKKDFSNKLVQSNESITAIEEKCSNLTTSHYKKETCILENIRACDEKNSENNLNKKISEKDKEKNDNMQRNQIIDNVIIQNIHNKYPKDKHKTEKTETELKDKSAAVIIKVEKTIFEWFSLDTLFYLYKEEKLKELLKEDSIKLKELLNSKLSVSGCSEKINKMIQLYGLLDTDSYNNSENKMNLKPLPDYSALKEEGKNLKIKVRSFYQGHLVKSLKEGEEKEEEESQTNSCPIYLPLIDAHAQVALRKKIVLDKLNKVLPELLKIFNPDFVLKMSEVRNLVTTFTLDAHNITFKPAEWYMIGVIIIKLLCLRDRHLNLVMQLETSESQILLILRSYGLQKDYLDYLLLRLTDSSSLMKKLNELNR